MQGRKGAEARTYMHWRLGGAARGARGRAGARAGGWAGAPAQLDHRARYERKRDGIVDVRKDVTFASRTKRNI